MQQLLIRFFFYSLLSLFLFEGKFNISLLQERTLFQPCFHFPRAKKSSYLHLLDSKSSTDNTFPRTDYSAASYIPSIWLHTHTKIFYTQKNFILI